MLQWISVYLLLPVVFAISLWLKVISITMTTTLVCSWIHLSDPAGCSDMKEIWRHLMAGQSLYSQIWVTTKMTWLGYRAGTKTYCVLITASDISPLLSELPLNIIIQEQNVNFAVNRPKLQNSTDSILDINLLTSPETGINNWANIFLSYTASYAVDTQLCWPSFAHSTGFQLYGPSCLSCGNTQFHVEQELFWFLASWACKCIWLYCLFFINTQVNKNGSSSALAKCFWCVGCEDDKCHRVIL